MELDLPTFGNKNHYPKIILTFGTNNLITSNVPNSGTNHGDFIYVELDDLISKPFLRKFTITAVELFIRSQHEYKKSYPEAIPQTSVVELSRSYRAAILDLVNTVQVNESTSELGAIYSQLDCIWHFCEIMFISSHPEQPLVHQYNEWIRVNVDDTDGMLVEIVSELPELDADNLERLWFVIYKLTFYGRTDEAWRLLEFTNQEQSDVYAEQASIMIHLMKSKPQYNPGKSSASDFTSKFDIWKQECEAQINNLAFCGNNQLTFLSEVLAGKEEGFKQARQFMSSWHEYLCMVLNYEYPMLRPASLKLCARKCFEVFENSSMIVSSLDKILFAAMEYDIVSVLKDMQTHWNHPWFPVHFSDLIFTGGVYLNCIDSRIDYKSVGPIRHDLVREYGIQLMQNPSLWEVGVKYLGSLPTVLGLPVLSELLMRKTFASEFEALKLIRVAKKHDLAYAGKSICRRVALEKYKEENWQNALLWSIRAEDAKLTATIVDKILLSGKYDLCPVLIKTMPTFTVCADRLIFLTGFCEFTKLVENRSFKDAIHIFCKLVGQEIVPTIIREKMLLSLREIMRLGEVKLEPVEVSILMQFLHEDNTKSTISTNLFQQMNRILMSARALEMLTQIQTNNKYMRSKRT